MTDIDERIVGTVSLMPRGLCSNLSLQGFGDLIAYLETLRGEPQN